MKCYSRAKSTLNRVCATELILALTKVLSYRKLSKETLLSIVFVLLHSILSDDGAKQPSHIYLAVRTTLGNSSMQGWRGRVDGRCRASERQRGISVEGIRLMSESISQKWGVFIGWAT